VDGFRYSQAMQNSAKQAGDDGKWTYENVNAFLVNPKAYMNGTLMAFAGLRSAQDRANLIAYLRSQSDAPAPMP
jgi:cytochrome c